MHSWNSETAESVLYGCVDAVVDLGSVPDPDLLRSCLSRLQEISRSDQLLALVARALKNLDSADDEPPRKVSRR